MKRFLTVFGLLLAMAFSILYVTKYNYLLTGVRTIYLTGHTTAYLTDYKKFSNSSVLAFEQSQAWPLHRFYNQYSLGET
ncbi:MAG: serine hydrolase, partial [Bacteroidota bacterium]|nr:serine hydrolase [Bacteroidota bacterium]